MIEQRVQVGILSTRSENSKVISQPRRRDWLFSLCSLMEGVSITRMRIRIRLLGNNCIEIRSHIARHSNLRASSSVQLKRDLTFEASLDITNTGNRDGWEVVQIYISSKESRVARPKKEFKAFSKV